MKMWKRYLKCALTTSIVSVLGLLTKVNADVFVERGQVPESVYQYVEENKVKLVHLDNIEDISDTDITISEPIGIYNVNKGKFSANKFPIFNHGNCIGVADIFYDKDGSLTYTVSFKGKLVDLVNELSRGQGNYRIVSDDSSHQLSLQHVETVKDGYSNLLQPLFEVEQEKINNRYIQSHIKERSSDYPHQMHLPINQVETQPGHLPWCAAYATARILSYEFSKDIRAREVMEWAYGKSNPNLETLSLPKYMVINYARSLGSRPYEVNRSLYRGEIMQELSNYRMIYASTHSENDENRRHAFVVYGYIKDEAYYSWNPWGEYLESSMSSDSIRTLDGETFWWDSSIRNFSWK